MNLSYVCPRCGAPTKFNIERHGLCIDCFLEMHRGKISEKIAISITVCLGCGRIRYGNKWYTASLDVFKDILTRLLRKTELKVYDISLDRISSNVLEELRGSKKIYVPVGIYLANRKLVTRYIEVRINKAFCPLCSKKQSGKYYESVIHIRYKAEIMGSLMDAIRIFIDKEWSGLENIETVDIKKDGAHGIVIRWSSRRMARRFLEHLKKKFSIIILRKYREQTLVSIGQGKSKQIVVEKYIIRIIHPAEQGGSI